MRKILDAVLKCMDTAHPIFAGDEVVRWPATEWDRFVKQKFIRQCESRTSINCTECADHHVEEVLVLEEPLGSPVRAYIHCPQMDSPDAFHDIISNAMQLAEPLPEPTAKNTSMSSADNAPPPACNPELRNHYETTYANNDGEMREGVRSIPISQIGKTLLEITSEWPRRVEALLFSDENGTIRYFESNDDLFAWIQEHMSVFWKIGLDSNGQSLISRGEIMSHLQAVTQKYIAVEELPHQPEMDGHYYAWKAPKDYKPTGEYSLPGDDERAAVVQG